MSLKRWAGQVSRRYLNKPVQVDGIKFASKTEARRYAQLQLLQRAGQISELRPHPKFDLVVNGHKVCTYTGDAEYIERGERVVEDTKSPRTRVNPTYRLKAKLMRACHGIEIREAL
jgi:hypothetical protein